MFFQWPAIGCLLDLKNLYPLNNYDIILYRYRARLYSISPKMTNMQEILARPADMIGPNPLKTYEERCVSVDTLPPLC
jgi:hypothetical protein